MKRQKEESQNCIASTSHSCHCISNDKEDETQETSTVEEKDFDKAKKHYTKRRKFDEDTEVANSLLAANLSEKLPREWTRGKLLGQGRFGIVFLLQDKMRPEDEKFVIKDMKIPSNQKDKSMREFRRETEILSILQYHERIIPYFGSCLTDTVASIFLSFMKCGTLSQYCENNGPLLEEECFHFTKQILQGLNYLHTRKIIHRDIKGSNILLETTYHLRLSDFGISKFLDISSNTTTLEVGTCRWMAPEICNPEINDGKYNFKADIWSVGCTIIEMLTGAIPYADLEREPAVIFRVGNAVPPAIPEKVSKKLTKVLKEKVFLKNPEYRQSAETLLQTLEKLFTKEHFSRSEYKLINHAARQSGGGGIIIKAVFTFFVIFILVNFKSGILDVICFLTRFQDKMDYPIWIVLLYGIFIFIAVICFLTRFQHLEMFFEYVENKLKDLETFFEYLRNKLEDLWTLDVHQSNKYQAKITSHNVCCSFDNHDCIISADSFKEHYYYNFQGNTFYSKELYKFIKSVADLTVLVTFQVKSFSWFRNPFRKPLMYAFTMKKNTEFNGTGMVYLMKTYSEFKKHWRYKSCPCQKCSANILRSNTWSEIHIMTAAHLIPCEFSNCKSTCHFFFDSSTEVGVTLEVVDIEEMDVKNNWCILRCVTCDLSLINRLDAASEKFDELRVFVNKNYRVSRDISKVAFLVSHPYGMHKHVSLSHWKCINILKNNWSEYEYSIKTFPGSAGAYVHVLGYSGKVWHYPHLHKYRCHSNPGFYVTSKF